MKEISFKIINDQPYIELIKLLQTLSIAQSGGHAKIMVSEGQVSVNGAIELPKRNKLRVGDLVELEGFRVTIL
jgi:ribosome-associated protein